MALNSKTLFGALEDIDENAGLDEGVDEEAVEVPGEVRDAEDDVEETGEIIDNAGEDVEKLEEIKDVLEEAADNGDGIDETAAKVVEVAVESIYARLGIKGSNIMGSAESFKNPRSRQTATKLAAEGIRERIKQVWEAIRKFFHNLWEKIKSLLAEYLTQAGRLENKAKALRKFVSERKGSKKEDGFKDKSLAAAFASKDGKQMEVGLQLDATLKDFEEAEKARAELASLIEKLSGDDADKKFDEIVRTVPKSAEFEIIGNKKIELKTEEKGADGFEVRIEVKDDSPENVDEDIKVESKDELVKHCDKVAEICRRVARSAKADKSYDKVKKSIDKAIERANKSVEGKSDEESSGLRRSAAAARQAIRSDSKLAVEVKRQSLAGCAKALTYVKKSANCYEK